MTPHVVVTGDIPQELFQQFKAMRTFVEQIPDFPDETLTCHAVCATLVIIYPHISCIDGTFSGFFDHSWLIDTRYPEVIMDMYPVAGASSYIIFAGMSLLPWRKLFTPKVINYSEEEKQRQIKKILDATK